MRNGTSRGVAILALPVLLGFWIAGLNLHSTQEGSPTSSSDLKGDVSDSASGSQPLTYQTPPAIAEPSSALKRNHQRQGGGIQASAPSPILPPEFIPDPSDIKNRDEQMMQEWERVRYDILADQFGSSFDVQAIVASLDERNASYLAQKDKAFWNPESDTRSFFPKDMDALSRLNQQYRKDVIAMIGEPTAEKLESERQRLEQSYALGPYTIPHDTF